MKYFCVSKDIRSYQQIPEILLNLSKQAIHSLFFKFTALARQQKENRKT